MGLNALDPCIDGIDTGMYETMSCEKSRKQSPWEHPGIGVWGAM